MIQRKDNAIQCETRAVKLDIKAIGADGSIEGYGSVFGVKDNYADMVKKGAFAVSLKEHKATGSMPAMLWQHETDEPIGAWTDMVEDEKGLRVKGQLCLETTKGKEAYALLKMGAINGLSIGFVSKKWDYDEETEVRSLTEIDLWEVSLVTFPANEKALITGVKAADIGTLHSIRDAERVLRDAGLSADVSRAFVAQVKRIALEERDVPGAAAAMKAAERLLRSLTT